MTNFGYKRFPIRKITQGDLKHGMWYEVGKKYTNDKYELAQIVYDDHFFHKSGSERYHLYLDAGADELYYWKGVTGRDITPEYDIYSQII